MYVVRCATLSQGSHVLVSILVNKFFEIAKSTHENHEKFPPRKFSAIRYLKKCTDCVQIIAHRHFEQKSLLLNTEIDFPGTPIVFTPLLKRVYIHL